MTDNNDNTGKFVQASRGPLGVAYEFVRQRYATPDLIVKWKSRLTETSSDDPRNQDK